MDQAEPEIAPRFFGPRLWMWLLAALAINWFFSSIVFERFLADHGFSVSSRIENFIAISGTLVLAWLLGFFESQIRWPQKLAIVVLSLAMPIILLVFLLTVGCWIDAGLLDIHGACL